jgi:hypothetical protein
MSASLRTPFQPFSSWGLRQASPTRTGEHMSSDHATAGLVGLQSLGRALRQMDGARVVVLGDVDGYRPLGEVDVGPVKR